MRKLFKLLSVVFVVLLVLTLSACKESKTKPVEIKLDKSASKYGIKLSEKEDFSDAKDSFIITPELNVKDSTFGYLNFKEAFKANGALNPSDLSFLAYTVNIKNNGSDTTNIKMNIKATIATNGAEKALRILIIQDGTVDESNIITCKKGSLFLKNDGHGDEVVVEKLSEEAEKKAFYDSIKKEFYTDDDNYGSFLIENIGKNETSKITFFFWLEGWDEDCFNDIIGGNLGLQFTLSVE